LEMEESSTASGQHAQLGSTDLTRHIFSCGASRPNLAHGVGGGGERGHGYHLKILWSTGVGGTNHFSSVSPAYPYPSPIDRHSPHARPCSSSRRPSFAVICRASGSPKSTSPPPCRLGVWRFFKAMDSNDEVMFAALM
jgi:hypothetical protein